MQTFWIWLLLDLHMHDPLGFRLKVYYVNNSPSLIRWDTTSNQIEVKKSYAFSFPSPSVVFDSPLPRAPQYSPRMRQDKLTERGMYFSLKLNYWVQQIKKDTKAGLRLRYVMYLLRYLSNSTNRFQNIFTTTFFYSATMKTTILSRAYLTYFNTQPSI